MFGIHVGCDAPASSTSRSTLRVGDEVVLLKRNHQRGKGPSCWKMCGVVAAIIAVLMAVVVQAAVKGVLEDLSSGATSKGR